MLNEDGDPNAHLKSVTEWLNSLLANDLAGDKLDNAAVNPYAMGTTGTGLDQLVDLITHDPGLNKKIATSEIYAGASAADKMNAIIVEGIRATSAADGGVIDAPEVKDINLDLAQVEYLDSSALGMLLLLNERLGKSRSKRLVVGQATGLVRKVLEVAKFDQVMTLQ